MSENKLKALAKDAANAPHADTSVSLEETLDELEDVRDHVNELIEAVKSDMDAN